jgi:predicted permease
MTAVPIIVAQFLWHDIGQSAVAQLFFGALFIVTYRSLLIVIFSAHRHVINAQRRRQVPWSQIQA